MNYPFWVLLTFCTYYLLDEFSDSWPSLFPRLIFCLSLLMLIPIPVLILLEPVNYEYSDLVVLNAIYSFLVLMSVIVYSLRNNAANKALHPTAKSGG